LHKVMCSNTEDELTRCQSVDDLLFLLVGSEPREHLKSNGKCLESLAKGVEVLLGENRRRHENAHLTTVVDGFEGGAERQPGLTVAHITTEQPIHRLRLLHVDLD